MYARKVDELGRIILPAEYRKKLQIHEGDEMEFFLDEEEKTIILMKREDFEKEE